ncbi:MAG: hypothetical protein ACRENE_26595 [Polyangiaceae bacterium]
MAVLVGACGTQELRFGLADAGGDMGTDTGAEAAPGRRGCTVDTDCPLSSLHCDTFSGAPGQCVACIKSEQCHDPSFPVCDYDLKECVECVGDGDCPGGRCEMTTHRCIPSCLDAGTCPGNLYCKRGECIECDDINAYCRSYDVCNTNIGQCVQCIDDRDCYSYSSHPKCDQTAGRCVECVTSSGCEPWEVCDPESHTCYDVGAGASGHDAGPVAAYADAGAGVGYDARP